MITTAVTALKPASPEDATAVAITRVVFGFLIGALMLLVPTPIVWALWHWVVNGQLGAPGLNLLEVYGGLILLRIVTHASSFEVKIDVPPAP